MFENPRIFWNLNGTKKNLVKQNLTVAVTESFQRGIVWQTKKYLDL